MTQGDGNSPDSTLGRRTALRLALGAGGAAIVAPIIAASPAGAQAFSHVLIRLAFHRAANSATWVYGDTTPTQDTGCLPAYWNDATDSVNGSEAMVTGGNAVGVSISIVLNSGTFLVDPPLDLSGTNADNMVAVRFISPGCIWGFSTTPTTATIPATTNSTFQLVRFVIALS